MPYNAGYGSDMWDIHMCCKAYLRKLDDNYEVNYKFNSEVYLHNTKETSLNNLREAKKVLSGLKNRKNFNAVLFKASSKDLPDDRREDYIATRREQQQLLKMYPRLVDLSTYYDYLESQQKLVEKRLAKLFEKYAIAYRKSDSISCPYCGSVFQTTSFALEQFNCPTCRSDLRSKTAQHDFENLKRFEDNIMKQIEAYNQYWALEQFEDNWLAWLVRIELWR